MTSSLRWKVLEAVSAPGALEPGDEKVNEDRVGANDQLAWVIDGATPLSRERLTEAPTDAVWLVDRIAEFLQRSPSHDDRPLTELLTDLIEVLREESRAWASQPRVPPSAALGLARLGDQRVDFLVVSDVTLVVSGPDTSAITDPTADRSQSDAFAEFQRRLRETQSLHEARQVLIPLVVRAREKRMNRPGGFWTVSTSPGTVAHAITGSTPVAETNRILLCSDGFARLVDVFGAYPSWEAFIQSDQSLAKGLEQVRSAERRDPECLDAPRTSSSDDAAAILVEPAEVS